MTRQQEGAYVPPRISVFRTDDLNGNFVVSFFCICSALHIHMACVWFMICIQLFMFGSFCVSLMFLFVFGLPLIYLLLIFMGRDGNEDGLCAWPPMDHLLSLCSSSMF